MKNNISKKILLFKSVLLSGNSGKEDTFMHMLMNSNVCL